MSGVCCNQQCTDCAGSADDGEKAWNLGVKNTHCIPVAVDEKSCNFEKIRKESSSDDIGDEGRSKKLLKISLDDRFARLNPSGDDDIQQKSLISQSDFRHGNPFDCRHGEQSDGRYGNQTDSHRGNHTDGRPGQIDRLPADMRQGDRMSVSKMTLPQNTPMAVCVKSERVANDAVVGGGCIVPSLTNGGPLLYGLPMAAYYAANPMACILDSSNLHHLYRFGSSYNPPATLPTSPASEATHSPLSLKKSSKHRSISGNDMATSEYRRSERGLSFLFPSFSDHSMSLMDKVQITIARHKNNYFLGWSQAELDRLDPLVRPKMMVTPEIYKEYCHRNAMKYDSNLQFAMESPEPWAVDFRSKLSLPPSDGGFTSLCEVKLEAGRLWREFSGKYRMHNIVKWQMDMNNSTTTTATPTDRPSTEGHRTGFRKYSKRGLHLKSTHPQVEMTADGIHPEIKQIDLQPSHEESQCASPVTGSRSERASPYSSYSNDFKASRMSRSLDNSPSVTDHFDHNGSTPSIPDIDGTSSVKSSPQNVPQTGGDESSAGGDFLFVPLPRHLSVADQLSIWLERHRNNYFLGCPPEQLGFLNAYLRPHVVPVTREIFQRHVPESMIDVLGKIEIIMRLDEPWANRFCDQVSRSSTTGGFATFEEALTEAVHLWNVNMAGRRNPDSSDNRGGSDTRSVTGRKRSHTSDNIKRDKLSSVSPTSPKRLLVNGHADVNSEVLPTKNCRITSEGNNNHTGPPMGINPIQVANVLWTSRPMLNALCQDNPDVSWSQRLAPFLSTLHGVLGSDYAIPVTTHGCTVDLILALIQKRLDDHFSHA